MAIRRIELIFSKVESVRSGRFAARPRAWMRPPSVAMKEYPPSGSRRCRGHLIGVERQDSADGEKFDNRRGEADRVGRGEGRLGPAYRGGW